jgi:peroxiredoxin Q/BCP
MIIIIFLRSRCGFRERNSQFKKANTIIVGISKDTIESHKKFAEKFKLPYLLLSDPQSEIMKKYGAFGKKDVRQRSAADYPFDCFRWAER